MMAKCSGVDLGCLTYATYAAKLSQITTPPASRAAHTGLGDVGWALRLSFNHTGHSFIAQHYRKMKVGRADDPDLPLIWYADMNDRQQPFVTAAAAATQLHKTCGSCIVQQFLV